MEAQRFVFEMTPPDETALEAVRDVLEARTQHLSRKRLPTVWRWIDRLEAVQRADDETLRRRRRREKVWAALLLLVGLFLLVPGLMKPKELPQVLIAGLLATVWAVAVLLRGRKKKPRDKFLAAAQTLVRGQAGLVDRPCTAWFDEEGLTFSQEGELEDLVEYGELESVTFRDGILLVVFGDRALILQLRDMTGGDGDALRQFLKNRQVDVI